MIKNKISFNSELYFEQYYTNQLLINFKPLICLSVLKPC